jgi:hypothetical protein
MRKTVFLFVLTAVACIAQTPTVARLKQLAANPGSPEFEQALKTALKVPALQKGTAYLEEGPDIIFAVEAASQPELYLDDERNVAMKAVGNSKLWYTAVSLKTGRSHSFYYMIAGARFGGSTDVPCFGPESYD